MGNEQLVKLLISKHGYNVNAKDINGNTVLNEGIILILIFFYVFLQLYV